MLLAIVCTATLQSPNIAWDYPVSAIENTLVQRFSVHVRENGGAWQVAGQTGCFPWLTCDPVTGECDAYYSCPGVLRLTGGAWGDPDQGFVPGPLPLLRMFNHEGDQLLEFAVTAWSDSNPPLQSLFSTPAVTLCWPVVWTFSRRADGSRRCVRNVANSPACWPGSNLP